MKPYTLPVLIVLLVLALGCIQQWPGPDTPDTANTADDVFSENEFAEFEDTLSELDAGLDDLDAANEVDATPFTESDFE